MKKLEEISKKFSSLKKLLNESNIHQLCNRSYISLSREIKGTSKETSPLKNLNLELKNNPINTHLEKSNNKNDEYFKNLLNSLESSKKQQKNNNNDKYLKKDNKSPQLERSRSPSINNVDDSPKNGNVKENIDIFKKDLLKEIKGKTIPLNEDEEDYDEGQNFKNKSDKNSNKIKSNKNISFYIIDKTDKNFNISEKITEFLNNYDDKLSLMIKTIPQMKLVDDFYYKSKESLIIKYIIDNNIINIDTIKKIIHLCFNVLSKVFSTLIKETENKINSLFNDIIDIIKMLLEFIKLIKTFITNNIDNVDVSFLKEMKNIGNYCLYAMIIKKYNYEYMSEIEKKNENEKKIKFFSDYTKYFKVVKKIKPIFKDNNLFMKHFIVQPSMISFIDLFEMNRKIINFQLNVNYKM